MMVMTAAISPPMILRRPGSRSGSGSGPAPPTAAPSAAATTPAAPAVALAVATALATVVVPVVVVVFRHPSPSAAATAPFFGTAIDVVVAVGRLRFEDDGVRWAHR